MGINEILQIGNNIKRFRISKGYSQKEMAVKLNIPYSTYSNYENNNREPGQEQLQKIADALEISIINLIGGDNYNCADTPNEVSEEHPVAFPGLEKKCYENGYFIGYGFDYAETSDDDIWISCPNGERIFISLEELESLNNQMDSYLKFLIDELIKKKSQLN